MDYVFPIIKTVRKREGRCKEDILWIWQQWQGTGMIQRTRKHAIYSNVASSMDAAPSNQNECVSIFYLYVCRMLRVRDRYSTAFIIILRLVVFPPYGCWMWQQWRLIVFAAPQSLWLGHYCCYHSPNSLLLPKHLQLKSSSTWCTKLNSDAKTKSNGVVENETA